MPQRRTRTGALRVYADLKTVQKLGVGAGVGYPGRRRVDGSRAGAGQRADGRDGHGGDVSVDPRNAKNTNEASGVAAQAVHVAQSAGVTVAKLGESSAEIGNVITVINQIAEQTNLLALNATIEAARAGDASRGFALVASEVKDLVRETSTAAEDVGRRIDATQSFTNAAVAAIGQISGIIAQINDSQSAIALAVEEQTATTNEMARNVGEAATGSTDIASNITGIARTAVDTQTAAASTSEAAGEPARMAADLQQLVGQFRC